MKKCYKCGEDKPLTHFYKSKEKKDGRQTQCVKCENYRRLKTCKGCGYTYQPNGRISAYCPNCYPYWRQASGLLSAAKHRARKKGLVVELDKPWIVERLKEGCPRTGIEFSLLESSDGYGSRGPYGLSLDKIDPEGDYTKENVQVVCWWYNAAKQRFSDEEVLSLCQKVVQMGGQ